METDSSSDAHAEGSGASASSGAAAEDDAMSLGSDGSDYVQYEEEQDLPVEEEEGTYWDNTELELYDPPSYPRRSSERPRLFTMIGEIRDGTKNWDHFLDRMKSHPEEVYNYHYDERDPTILHYLLQHSSRDDVPTAVWNAVLDEWPHAARLFPLPLYLATKVEVMVPHQCMIVDPQVFARILRAYPDAIQMRHHFRAQRFGDNYYWALHALVYGFTLSGSRLDAANSTSCAGAARILMEFCPELALEKHDGRLPIEELSRGSWMEPSSGKDFIWPLYMTILRGTCKALYSKQNITDVTSESFLLHTAVQFVTDSDIISHLLKTMPHLAKAHDSNGDFALSLALSNPNMPENAIQEILEANPSASSHRNREGRLPLHIAANTGRSWTTLKCIFDAEPRALKTRDTEMHFYPFMFAAIGEKSNIDKVYLLLRKEPILCSGIAQVPHG